LSATFRATGAIATGPGALGITPVAPTTACEGDTLYLIITGTGSAAAGAIGGGWNMVARATTAPFLGIYQKVCAAADIGAGVGPIGGSGTLAAVISAYTGAIVMDAVTSGVTRGASTAHGTTTSLSFGAPEKVYSDSFEIALLIGAATTAVSITAAGTSRANQTTAPALNVSDGAPTASGNAAGTQNTVSTSVSATATTNGVALPLTSVFGPSIRLATPQFISTSASSFACPSITGFQPGDLHVIEVRVAIAGSGATVTVNTPANYTLAHSSSDTATGQSVYVFTRRLASGNTAPTVTFSGNSLGSCMSYVLRGAASITCASAYLNAGTSVPMPAHSITSDNSLVIYIGATASALPTSWAIAGDRQDVGQSSVGTAGTMYAGHEWVPKACTRNAPPSLTFSGTGGNSVGIAITVAPYSMPQLVGFGRAAGVTATTLTATTPVGAEDGDTLYAIVTSTYTGGTVNVTPPDPAWTLAASTATASGLIAVYRKDALGDPATATWTFGDSGSHGVQILAFKGPTQVELDASAATTTAATSTPAPASVTPATSGGLMVQVWNETNTGAFGSSVPTGSTALIGVSSSTYFSIIGVAPVNGTTAGDVAAWTMSGAPAWQGMTLIIRTSVDVWPETIPVYLSSPAASTVATADQLALNPPTATASANTTGISGTGFWEMRSQGGAAGTSLGSLAGLAAQTHGWLLDAATLEGVTIKAGNYTDASAIMNGSPAGALAFKANDGTTFTGTPTLRLFKRSSAGVYTLIGTGTMASTVCNVGVTNIIGISSIAVASDVTFAAGDKLYIDVIMQVTANTGVTSIAVYSWLAGSVLGFPIHATMRMGVVAMTAESGMTVTGPGNLITPLDLYLTADASTTLPTTGGALDTAPPSTTTVANRIGTTAARWWNVEPQGNSSNVNFASEPAFGSGDFVWVYETTALEGKRIPAGNWTPTLEIDDNTGTASSITVVVIVGIRHSDGTYTEIGRTSVAGLSLSTTNNVQAFPVIAGSQTDLVTGDKLVIEVDLDVVTNGTGSTKDFRITVGANSHLDTPGFKDPISVIDAGVIALAATAGMTVTGKVTKFGTVAMTATSTLTASAAVTVKATVSLSGTAGASIAATNTALAAVSMSAASSLSAAGQATAFGLAAMSATAALSAGGLVTVAAVASLSATAGLTAGAIVAVRATVVLAGSSSMVVTSVVTTSATVSLAGSAGLTVTSVVTTSGAVVMSVTTTLTVIGTRVVLGAVVLSATAGLVALPSVTVQAAVVMSGTASLTVSGKATTFGVVAMSSTTTLTAAGSVTELAAVQMTAVASLTASGKATVLAAVTLSGIGGLTVTSVVTVLAAASLMGVASLTVSGKATTFATVAMSGSGGLVVAGQATTFGIVAMTAASSMTVAGVGTAFGVAVLTATASLTVIGKATTFGVVAMSAAASASIAAAVLELASVSMSAASGMTVIPAVTVLAVVALSGDSTLVVGGVLTVPAAVAMTATTTLSMVTIIGPVGVVHMAATSDLLVAANVTELAVVGLTADAGMTVDGIATVSAVVDLTAVAALTVAGIGVVPGLVSMSAPASLTVAGVGTVPAIVDLTAVAALTVVPAVTVLDAVAMSATAGLAVVDQVSVLAAVMMSAVAELDVSGLVLTSGVVTMSATAGLTVIDQVTVLAVVAMTAASSLSAEPSVASFGLVAMSADATLTVAALVILAWPWVIRFGEARAAWSTGALRDAWRAGDATDAWRVGILRAAWRTSNLRAGDEAAAVREQ
jgi:hypothetical protein